MDDTNPTPIPDQRPMSVRALSMLPSCPVCGTSLTGKQTVCSPKCRAARARERRETDARERDAKIRLKLKEILQLLEEDSSV